MRRQTIHASAVALASGLMATTFAAAPAQAQGVRVQSADAVLAPAAAFYRVEDGVFALRPGMSVDLTDRKILFAMRADWAYSSREPNRFYVMLNGKREVVRAGSRIDLKNERATAASVQDKESCFIDVVSFVAPKGAPPTATFRVSCI